MPGLFDSTYFNAEVFGKYVETIGKDRVNELIKSQAVVVNDAIKAMMTDQTGGNIVTIPMKGRIGGTPDNYDGQTDINSTSLDTYKQTRVVVGRAKAWTEKDFVYDITGGYDPMRTVAEQILEFWEEVKQDTLLDILEGVFSMTGAANKEFVDTHTYQDAIFRETTLNTALQKAVGQHKSKFALAIMHSAVATQLENLNLISYLKYTDSNGVQRDLTLGSLNGRTVIIDDSMPVVEDKYTTYVLGAGAFELTNAGAKVPYETDRDPKKNGGEDTLYTRDRFCFSPYGISFTEKNMASLSPTNDELKNGANWELVKSTKGKAIPHKTIPIARIITGLTAEKPEEPVTP